MFWFGQNKQFEDITLGSGKLLGIFTKFCRFYGLNNESINNKKKKTFKFKGMAATVGLQIAIIFSDSINQLILW